MCLTSFICHRFFKKCMCIRNQLSSKLKNKPSKDGPIPLFSDTFDTKYRAENFTDTDSDTDTNSYSYTVACISHQMSYLLEVYK